MGRKTGGRPLPSLGPAGLLSCYCQLELEVTITDVVNLLQSPSLSDRKFTAYPYNCNESHWQALFETSQFREESDVDFDKREMLRTTWPGTNFNSQ